MRALHQKTAYEVMCVEFASKRGSKWQMYVDRHTSLGVYTAVHNANGAAMQFVPIGVMRIAVVDVQLNTFMPRRGAKVFNWFRYDRRTKRWVRTKPPRQMKEAQSRVWK